MAVFDVALFNEVRIKKLELTGSVGCIQVDPNFKRYLIRYFWNGDLKEHWLYRHEFELIKAEKN